MFYGIKTGDFFAAYVAGGQCIGENVQKIFEKKLRKNLVWEEKW